MSESKEEIIKAVADNPEIRHVVNAAQGRKVFITPSITDNDQVCAERMKRALEAHGIEVEILKRQKPNFSMPGNAALVLLDDSKPRFHQHFTDKTPTLPQCYHCGTTEAVKRVTLNAVQVSRVRSRRLDKKLGHKVGPLTGSVWTHPQHLTMKSSLLDKITVKFNEQRALDVAKRLKFQAAYKVPTKRKRNKVQP